MKKCIEKSLVFVNVLKKIKKKIVAFQIKKIVLLVSTEAQRN